MEKTKICNICLREIDLEKDNYCNIKDYHNGKFFVEGFYHTNCYNEKVGESAKMKNMAQVMFKRASGLMDSLGIEDKREVILR